MNKQFHTQKQDILVGNVILDDLASAIFRDIENNIHDLSDEIHKETYEFVLQNWSVWVEEYLSFCGGLDKLSDFIISRLKDSNFPKKNWIYLFMLNCISDKNMVIRYIEAFKETDSPNVKKIIENLEKKVNKIN